ncbi:MAG: hypothetical protein OXF32_02420 [Anaerolineaceae bacterium]|nr:hypothetical protein [Anaerolineaceae bacterium]
MSLQSIGLDKRTTHVGFADEAYWSRGEYRAVACVSARRGDYREVERRLCASRCDAGAIVSEIKWKDLNNNRRQRDAASVLEAAVSLAANRELHIDVLVWNQQARNFMNRLRGGRGKRNSMHLQMMYGSLFLRVISRWRTAEGSVAPFWTLAPDRHTGLDFPALQNEIRGSMETAVHSTIEVRDIKESLNYSIQLADLLAGMAAFSHQYSDDYETWLGLGKQLDLRLTAPQWSTRFPLLDLFSRLCQASDLGPTMLSDNPAFPGRGLWTQEPGVTHHTIDFQPFTPSP